MVVPGSQKKPIIRPSTPRPSVTSSLPPPTPPSSSGGWYVTARDNNPFNIVSTPGTRTYNGVVGTKIAQNSGKAFLVFDTLDNGIRAGMKNISNYFTRRRLRTVQTILAVYAPPGNPPYVNFVVDYLQDNWNRTTTSTSQLPDFKGKTETNPNTIKMFRTLVKAMYIFEGGNRAYLSKIDNYPISNL